MIRSRTPLLKGAAIVGAMWLGGCVEADKAGTPHLVSFDPIDGTGSVVARDPDAAVFTVSPRASFRALFNDLLDFTQIVDVDAGVGLPGLVTVTAPNNPTVDTVYTPNGHYKFTLIYTPGPNISATISPGLPSNVAVVVALNTASLHGHNGAPLVIDPGASPTLMFQTAAFTVSGENSAMPEAPIDADHAFVITASNLPADDFATKVTASSTSDLVSTPVEVTVAVSDSDPTQFSVAPKAGTWTSGAKITVTVAAEAADKFGVPLGAPASIDFNVAPAMAAP